MFHHSHGANSSHRLIALSANIDGTIGVNNLDINDNFWIVLYSQSPNTERGWDLRYQGSSLCNNSNGWYRGSQAGWTTTLQNGCPDSHIHIARRDLAVSDGARATITANYPEGDPVVETQDFSFLVLPNLAPNSTSFTSPVASGVYDGGAGEVKNLDISWNPAIDANGDSLTYTIYLLDSGGTEVLPALVTDTSNTNFVYNITGVANGVYGLKGIVCDQEPLCTTFYLSSSFTIEKVDPIYSLSAIAISSNNLNSILAKDGDTVTLSFTVSDSGDISGTLNVDFYSGGILVTDNVVLNKVGDIWTASYVVSESDTDGIIDFVILADNLDFEYSLTNDDSYIIVDNTSPDSVVANPAGGAYRSPQTITLSSAGSSEIRYTTDDTFPSCSLGLIYDSEINISETTTIKAIGCDQAGNYSMVLSFDYNIRGRSSSGSYILNFPKKKNNILDTEISQQVALICPGIILSRNIKLISPNMKGEDIRYLQNYLNTCQNVPNPLILDGIYGSKTKQAVIKFQLANNLVGDGIVGPLTRAVLNK